MKKISHIVLAFALCGSLLLFGRGLFGTPLENPLNSYTPSSGIGIPFFVKHSPLNLLFSFEGLDHPVCRKPVFLFNTSPATLNNLRYNSVFFKTTSLGPNYFRVNENITLRNGNTFLLIPHSFTLPVNPGLEPLPGPTMTLQGTD
ncbi:MAG: hypothetical protein ACRDE2_07060 [Chitinophagaceae bacterium]